MPAGRPPSRRTRVAAALGRATAALVRRLRGGSGGSVIGARVTLAVAPAALDELAAGRPTAIVSGTNGKSTTTALLAAAAAAAGQRVVSNTEGANLRTGVVAALSTEHAGQADLAVLEIDELALASLLPSFDRPIVTLLNLSRDQLDRFGEVRSVAASWRRALEAHGRAVVVANADDPLVVWGAGGGNGGRDVRFVGVGMRWWSDAGACPACGARVEHADGRWRCTSCDLRRPPARELRGTTLLDLDGGVLAEFALQLPGPHNVGNAALALVAAMALGVDGAVAARSMNAITSVAGRYRTVSLGGTTARLLLAKNPAGWSELLGMIEHEDTPLVLAVNARIADSRDTSWIWDVPFERIAGRRVTVAGERATDLAVRLHYAGVDADSTNAEGSDLREVLERLEAPEVDLIANYTAFADLTRALPL